MKFNKIFPILIVLLLAAGCHGASQTASPGLSKDSGASQTPVASPVAGPPPSVSLPVPTLHTVGQVTRHAKGFINQRVRVRGYILKQQNGYILFSDESGGAIGQYDLPVTGVGIETVQPNHTYELQGLFVSSGLMASNHNPNHLELEIAPKLIN